jgi:NAD(P)-dependent dehydrogenase (short-subunit alcohol dehydrogenase family)
MEAAGSTPRFDPTVGFNVAGKTVVVTGSTRGIGHAIAEGFVHAGADVWIHGRRDADCRSVAESLSCEWVSADLNDLRQVSRLVDELTRRTSRIDVLVNNAGVEIITPIEKMTASVLQRTLQVNTVAPVLITHGLLGRLSASGGASIINVTSIHQAVPYPNNAAYSMSKAALEMFTKTAAIELAGLGIRINNIAPGAIETEINREVLDEIGREKFAEWIPAGRVGSTAEVVGACIFLASAAASYITGTTLFADGGYAQNLVRYRPE